jgi:glycosyltransferase involved in cell wall biosynthesis
MSARQIYFDKRWCGQHGIGRFATELAAHLPGLSPLSLPLAPSHPLDTFLLTVRMAYSHRNALFFSPGYNVPFIAPRPYVFTIHDLNHLDTPSSVLKRTYYQLLMKPACRRAALVLTVSDFSRHRILEWSGANPERIRNVGNGVSDVFVREGQRLDVGNSYFLCVGNRKPHKNELRVVQAFAVADIPAGYLLLFTGLPSTELVAEMNRLGIQGRVRFLGSLNDSDLARAYRGARALLFPSLYEGFGLPLVESMACGIPVLTSNCTALPEIAGGAALLVDPRCTSEIVTGVESLVADMKLHSGLVRRGLERAAHFRWEAVANRVRQALDEIA